MLASCKLICCNCCRSSSRSCSCIGGTSAGVVAVGILGAAGAGAAGTKGACAPVEVVTAAGFGTGAGAGVDSQSIGIVSGIKSFPRSPISRTTPSIRVSKAAASSCSAFQNGYHIRVPMIKPTASSIAARQWLTKALGNMQGVAVRLTPALRQVVLLHHQRDHVQLLLMGVVGWERSSKLSGCGSKKDFPQVSAIYNHARASPSNRQFADSLYFKLTPYSITSAPSIASLIASMVEPFMFVRSNHVA
eukprot:COSAG02_NODE_327_length_24561_cov_92.867754_11_plen_247_part_00